MSPIFNLSGLAAIKVSASSRVSNIYVWEPVSCSNAVILLSKSFHRSSGPGTVGIPLPTPKQYTLDLYIKELLSPDSTTICTRSVVVGSVIRLGGTMNSAM